jgi:hypothetical protein
MRLRDPAALTSVISGLAFVASKFKVERAPRVVEPTTLRFPIAGAPAVLDTAVKEGMRSDE